MATARVVDVVNGRAVGAIGYLLWPNNIGSSEKKQKYADDRKRACMVLACIRHRKSADDERARLGSCKWGKLFWLCNFQSVERIPP